MTNKQRFLDAQAVFNRRMSTRRSRSRRALIVRILYAAGIALALVLVVCSVFPELRHQIAMMVGRIFSVFGISS